MQSRTRLMLALILMLAVPGCAGSVVIAASPNACASLLPTEWNKGVDHTDIPDAAPAKPADIPGQLAWTLGELKKWTGFGVSEANKLDQANGRTADAIGIVGRCEARDAAAAKKAKPKFLGFIG